METHVNPSNLMKIMLFQPGALKDVNAPLPSMFKLCSGKLLHKKLIFQYKTYMEYNIYVSIHIYMGTTRSNQILNSHFNKQTYYSLSLF